MIAGGDHTIIQRLSAARLFSCWENNVGAMRRQCNVEHFSMEFGGTVSNQCRFGNIGTVPGSSVLPRNLPRWRADNIRPYVWCMQRWRVSATELPSGNFGAFVGEDIIFPVVSPWGNNVGAFAPTMQCQIFANKIRRRSRPCWLWVGGWAWQSPGRDARGLLILARGSVGWIRSSFSSSGLPQRPDPWRRWSWW